MDRTIRDRDKGRKYKSRYTKRQEKAEDAEKIRKLPKITQWLKGPNQSHSVPGEESTSTVTEKTQKHTTTLDEAAEVKPEEPVHGGSMEFDNDLGLWPNKLDEHMRSYWIEMGSSECRHYDGDFSESSVKELDRTRHCTKALFSRTHTLSSETLDLTWLCYSKTTGRVYCFVCELMSDTETLLTTGFNDWKHARNCIESHSRSDQHRKALADLTIRKSVGARVDTGLVKQYETECNYWRQVLRRCVDVLKFLCERGLAIRGKDQLISSVHNGNYLGILELLSIYDSFLSAHISKHANKGSGHTSYLSHIICEELIQVMGDKVLSTIITEVQNAKYFSVSVDSTPDISHTDQLSFTIRYVLRTGPVERYLKFIPMLSHTGKEIAEIVLNFLKEKRIHIADCRGQSYDNASNMSGKYRGTQSYIKDECCYAEYVPCMGHSLNLVGQCAVESCPDVVALFNLIQNIYAYLVASTHRWRKPREALQNNKKLTVDKSLSDTRWSARADAVKALSEAYNENLTVLEELSTDDNQTAETRAEATGLVRRLKLVETAILLEVWHTILDRFHKTNMLLQKAGLSLNTAVELLESLLKFVEDLRERFDEFEQRGIEKCGHSDYKEDKQRARKRKRHHDELGTAEDVKLPHRDKFRVNAYLPIIDKLCAALNQRLEAYVVLRGRFGFLSDMLSLPTNELREAAANHIKCYPQDLEKSLESEIVQFAAMFTSVSKATGPDSESSNTQTEANESVELQMFLAIHANGWVETFTNVEIALRVHLCMFVTNCTGERSFSKLKLIKNYLRSTMGQDRLSTLTLLSVEHETFRKLDFGRLIDDFSMGKVRKRPF